MRSECFFFIIICSRIVSYGVFAMSKECGQKVKLLKIYELFRNKTSRENPLRTHEIVQYLNSIGVSSDRRTLAKDISTLRLYGYDVGQTKIGKEFAFYLENNDFEFAELRSVIDAVQAASFIPDKETKVLIDKLANLAGERKSEILKKNLVYFNNRKHTNHEIFQTIDTVSQAIREKKKIAFRYYDLNEKAKPVFRNNGTPYIVEPMALVYNEDNYYLVCYNQENVDKQATYRVDRMTGVEILTEKVSKEAVLLKSSIPRYMDSVFKMYAGRSKEVVLRFDGSVLNAFFDKFGEKTKVTKLENGLYEAKVGIQESPTFDAWLAQFGEKITKV